MHIESFYPVLMARDVQGVAAFYRELFGFEVTFESDWYVSLKSSGPFRDFELAVLHPDHPTVPQGYGSPSQGVIVNVEVDDAATHYRRIVDGGLAPEVLTLRDEEFGQRHFIVVDPGGGLVDVIENIPPSGEFAAMYTEQADGQG